MSKKPVGNLGAFMASKADAAPAPLHREPPRVVATNDDMPAIAKVAEPVRPVLEMTPPKAAAVAVPVVEKEEMVTLNMRVPKSFHRALKRYALDLEKGMSDIVREGVELHRQKHGKKLPASFD